MASPVFVKNIVRSGNIPKAEGGQILPHPCLLNLTDIKRHFLSNKSTKNYNIFVLGNKTMPHIPRSHQTISSNNVLQLPYNHYCYDTFVPQDTEEDLKNKVEIKLKNWKQR